MIDFITLRPELFWFIMGFILFVLELIIPGFVIFFFGLGAWFTSFICLILNPGINIQVIIFAFVSIISLLTLRKYLNSKFFASRDDPEIDVDDDFTGRTAVAISSFDAGSTGRIEFRGSHWNAESTSDIKEGQEVVIVNKNNVTMIVKPK